MRHESYQLYKALEVRNFYLLVQYSGISPLKIFFYYRMYANMTTSSNQIAVGGGTKTIGMFSKLLSQGSSFVMEGVKNLVVKRHVSIF